MPDRKERLDVGEHLSKGYDIIDSVMKSVETAEANGDKTIREDTIKFVDILLTMFQTGDEEIKEYKDDKAYERAMEIMK